jgi:hypothetical protein
MFPNDWRPDLDSIYDRVRFADVLIDVACNSPGSFIVPALAATYVATSRFHRSSNGFDSIRVARYALARARQNAETHHRAFTSASASART